MMPLILVCCNSLTPGPKSHRRRRRCRQHSQSRIWRLKIHAPNRKQRYNYNEICAR